MSEHIAQSPKELASNRPKTFLQGLDLDAVGRRRISELFKIDVPEDSKLFSLSKDGKLVPGDKPLVMLAFGPGGGKRYGLEQCQVIGLSTLVRDDTTRNLERLLALADKENWHVSWKEYHDDEVISCGMATPKGIFTFAPSGEIQDAKGWGTTHQEITPPVWESVKNRFEVISEKKAEETSPALGEEKPKDLAEPPNLENTPKEAIIETIVPSSNVLTTAIEQPLVSVEPAPPRISQELKDTIHAFCERMNPHSLPSTDTTEKAGEKIGMGSANNPYMQCHVAEGDGFMYDEGDYVIANFHENGTLLGAGRYSQTLGFKDKYARSMASPKEGETWLIRITKKVSRESGKKRFAFFEPVKKTEFDFEEKRYQYKQADKDDDLRGVVNIGVGITATATGVQPEVSMGRGYSRDTKIIHPPDNVYDWRWLKTSRFPLFVWSFEVDGKKFYLTKEARTMGKTEVQNEEWLKQQPSSLESPYSLTEAEIKEKKRMEQVQLEQSRARFAETLEERFNSILGDIVKSNQRPGFGSIIDFQNPPRAEVSKLYKSRMSEEEWESLCDMTKKFIEEVTRITDAGERKEKAV